MAALEPYYFEPNMLQNSEMKVWKIVKWIITWKKKDFVDLVIFNNYSTSARWI